jgi:dynein heavy chain
MRTVRRAHVHGDDIFSRDDITELSRTKGLNPYDFIQIIKRDPELAEDFWYCNRRASAYDFEFVPFDKRNEEEYLTISSRGVTHYINREAIFMTL